MRSRSINIRLGEEILRWNTSEKGKYNSKDGYLVLTKKNQVAPYLPLNLCWNKVCLPKTRIFTWFIVQGRVLIANRFKKIGYNGPSWFPLCKQEEEDGDHLFLNCSFVQSCWHQLLAKLQWQTMLPNTLLELLKSWLSTHRQAMFFYLWFGSPSILIWELWKELNRHIFQEKELPLQSILSKIEVCIVELINLRVSDMNPKKLNFT